MSGADAQEKIAAGANLIQIHSGLIYEGPDLIRDVAETLRQVAIPPASPLN